MKNLINSHIERYLSNIIEIENEEFNQNYDRLSKYLPFKIEDIDLIIYRNLLKYVHFILDNSLFKNVNEFDQIHLHFQVDNNNLEDVIASYLVMYYNIKLRDSDLVDEDNLDFLSFKNKLNKHISTAIRLSDNSRKGNRKHKQDLAIRKFLKLKKEDCDTINSNTSFNSKVLFNSNTSIIEKLDYSSFSNLSNRISLSINQRDNYYAHPFYHFYINENIDIKSLGKKNKEFVENLEHIILFEKSNRVKHIDYSNNNLERYLKKFYKLKTYLNVTFDKEHKQNSLSALESKSYNFQQKYNLDKRLTYTITNHEINWLLDNKTENLNKVKYQKYGDFSLDFYEDFFQLARQYGLDEFRSIKFHNILNTIINLDLKEYIIYQLFENKESKFLSDETKEIIFYDLDKNDITELKSSLNRLLNYSIRFYEKWNFVDTNKVVIENVLLKDSVFLEKFYLNSSTKIISNYEFLNNYRELQGKYHTFCYQNRGNRHYNFYPNTIEYYPNSDLKIIYLSNSSINKSLLKEIEYKYYRDYFKVLNHEIRRLHFDFDILNKELKKNKPESRLILNVDQENTYSNYNTSERYLITYKELNSKGKNLKRLSRPKTDVAIVKDKKNDVFGTVPLEDFLMSDEDYGYFDFLDKILEEIDIMTLFNDKSDDNQFLDSIAKEFLLEDINSFFLWKHLLKRRASEIGKEKLLNDLREKLESKIVSDNHFYNRWLDVNSDMISPRSKKIFKKLCEYLNLPNKYFLTVLRYKLSQVGSSRENNKFLEDLAVKLISIKCFDENSDNLNYSTIINNNIEIIKEDFDFESLGIEEEFIIMFLELLVNEIKARIQLKQFQSIEIRNA